MAYRIKNWKKFQHFNNRRPPWIKLYREILDDVDWFTLTAECKALLVSLWLIASETDGELPELRKIAFRLRITEQQLKPLINSLSHWVEHDDVRMISRRYQDDTPERETEREGEKERETENNIAAKRPAAVTLQADFVEKFQQTYQAKTGQPYRASQKDFVISSGLIKAHGLDACVKKAVILAGLCETKSAWFTKDGWASYTIGKLSSQWNSIIPEARQLTDHEELQVEIKKQEAMRERANSLVK